MDLRRRLLLSYGALTEISHLLEPAEFIILQHLNRWAYKIGIARCQMRLWIDTSVHFFSSRNSKWKHEVLICDPRGRGRKVISDMSVSFGGTITLQVGDELYGYRRESAYKWRKFTLD